MTGFVAGHLVDGVVDGVEVEGFGAFGEVGLAGGGTVFGVDAHLEVLLGAVSQHFAQQLGKFGGVLGFLKGGFLPVETHLGIALAVSHAGHGQVHTHLFALTFEVGAEVHLDVLGGILGHADYMLGGPGLDVLFHFLHGFAADGAFLGHFVAFIDVAAHGADEFFTHNGFCF